MTRILNWIVKRALRRRRIPWLFSYLERVNSPTIYL